MTGELHQRLRAGDAAVHGLTPLEPLLRAAQKLGIDVDAICRDSGLLASSLAHGDTAVGPEALLAFLAELAGRAKEAPLALLAAEALEGGEIRLLEYLPPSSPTLKDAAALASGLFPLLTRLATFHVDDVGREAHAVLEPLDGAVLPPLGAEYVLAGLALLARRVTGRDLAPIEVRFAHAPSARSSLYESFFRAPVVFGAARNELVYPREFLEMALSPASIHPGSSDSIPPPSSENLDDKDMPLAHRVRVLLAEGLRSGEVTIDELARRLCTSRRTLQRHLQRQGTSHSALLDDVRRELGVLYIRDGNLSVTQVARTLGFADASTFARAFRRWTGRSPLDFRGAMAANRSHELSSAAAAP